MSRSRAAELLEKISSFIPGIQGYQEREKRRDADRAVRERAAQSVYRCREKLTAAITVLSHSAGGGSLRAIGELERYVGRLERIEDRLRYAFYGYSGWFDRTAVGIDELERCYEYDLNLLETAEGLDGLLGAADHPGGIRVWIDGFERGLEALEHAVVDRREHVEKGEEKG